MTVREFYLDTRKRELPAFQRVLGALPQDKFHYKPHDRSPSAEQIVWTITNEMAACQHLIETGQLDFEQAPPPAPAKMLELFDRHYSRLLQAVEKMSEADWNNVGQFKMGGKVLMEQPIGQFLWLFHQDAIHHRGQLAAYLRPMGAKVPSIYGPSGDDPGPMAN